MVAEVVVVVGVRVGGVIRKHTQCVSAERTTVLTNWVNKEPQPSSCVCDAVVSVVLSIVHAQNGAKYVAGSLKLTEK